MLLAIFSAFLLGADAQITVTSTTFPTAGDTLHYAFDGSPNVDAALTPPGGDQVWDLSSLAFEDTYVTVYSNANAGSNFASFPGADVAILGDQGETYFNVTGSKFDAMGYAGSDPAGFGVDVIAKFSPAFPERKSPLNFFDITINDTDLSLPFSTDALPDSLTANIPGIQLLDSIRVRIHQQRLEAVDGWGTCKIPGGTYPVLRVKRTDYRTTAVDAHSSFLGWFDISTLIGGGAGGGFLGTDTTVSFRFLSNTEKEEIAVLTTDNQQSTVETARFKNNLGTTPVILTETPGNANIQAFPNPAIEWVRFDCTNLPADDYTLKIFNIIGKVVWKENYYLTGNKSFRVDLDNFKKGTYLYSLSNKKGDVIGTKRLVVVKP